MNPERNNERAADDRMNALLEEKKRIESEIKELEQRRVKAARPARLQKIKVTLVGSFAGIICLSGLVLFSIYKWQPLDVYIADGKITKTANLTLPPCGVRKDESGKLYYPEKCGGPIKYFKVIFTDNKGNKILFSAKNNEYAGWDHDERQMLPCLELFVDGCGTTVMAPKTVDIYQYGYREKLCDKAGCKVSVYYLKNRWLKTINVLKPVIELEKEEIKEDIKKEE